MESAEVSFAKVGHSSVSCDCQHHCADVSVYVNLLSFFDIAAPSNSL